MGLAACQTTLVNVEDQLAPLDRALTADPAALEVEANEGDVQAQIALSIVHSSGLSGYRRNRPVAAYWRGLAMSARRTIPITQYTAAFNGQPSRVNIINVQTAIVSPGQFEAVDRCLGLLSGRVMEPVDACGSIEQRQRRERAWALVAR